MADDPALRLHRICISAAAVAETVGNTPLVSVPRAEVHKLRIKRGVITERPLVLTLFGLAATAFGGFALLLIRWTWFSDSYHAVVPKWPWAVLPLLAVGPAMIHAAFRTGVFVLVETSRTTRKLGFGAKVSRDELARFVDAARSSGLDVEISADLLRA